MYLVSYHVLHSLGHLDCTERSCEHVFYKHVWEGSMGEAIEIRAGERSTTVQRAVAAAVVFYGGGEGNEDLAEKTRAAILGHSAPATAGILEA